jgi:acetyltransferase
MQRILTTLETLASERTSEGDSSESGARKMERDRATHRSGVHRALEPTSVAVVGASRDEAKRGYVIFDILDEWKFEGTVYAENPKYAGETIQGHDVYETASAIGEPVDLACVLTPAQVVPEVLEDCGRAGVGGALIFAAGFGELGNHEIEERILASAREHDIRILGPNTNGLINVHHGLDLLGRPDIPRGGIAMLSQSGNLASGLVQEAIHANQGGFSFYISVGNESDVTFDECLGFLSTHEKTDVVTCYVEGMADGRSFLQEAASFVRDRPIAALKGGLSDVGRRSAQSHTASIAGSAAVIDDVYRQAGVVRVERADELLAVSDSLANLPPAVGPNVAILSDGGGHATHAADSLVEMGLVVPELDPETQAAIRERIPEQAPNVTNPVDVLTLEHDLDIYADCAAALLDDPNVHALLLCGYFGGYASNYDSQTEAREATVAERIIDLMDAHDTPVVVQSIFAEQNLPAIRTLADSPITVLDSINTATRCIAALETYGHHLRTATQKSDFVVSATDESSSIVTEAFIQDRTRLSEFEAKRLLQEYDAPVTPMERVESTTEAVDAATRFDGPVAMKVLSRDIVHKSEVGGVALDVEGAASVRSTYENLMADARAAAPGGELEGVLVSPMVEEGIEVIVGITGDEELGPVVMFGLGGIFVEVLRDVSFRAVPLTEFDARRMIEDIDASPILQGTRGKEGVDQDALVDLLLKVSEVACENPRISELDVNPAIATPEGIEIVDATVVLETD